MESTETINERIIELRQRGVKPVSVNTWLRCIKAYYLWQNKQWTIGRLKEEQTILQTLSANDILAILRYKAVGTNLLRAHIVALTILDTGLRASEVLGLTKENIDFDNLIINVLGKGGKHRLVPFSFELRKVLFRYQQSSSVRTGHNGFCYLFGTKNNTKVSVRNLERDFKVLGEKVGITGRFHPHLLRHVFAINWITKGGDIYQLSRVLGHSSITTMTIYLRSLGTEVLQATQARVSLLSR